MTSIKTFTEKLSSFLICWNKSYLVQLLLGKTGPKLKITFSDKGLPVEVWRVHILKPMSE